MLTSTRDLGFVFQQQRHARSLTQEAVAQQCGPGVSRTALALLEQGRRVPTPLQLERLAQILEVPEGVWKPFASPDSAQRHELEGVLTELVGELVTLQMSHAASTQAVESAIRRLFSGDLTGTQAYDMLNSVLVYYGIRPMKRDFFDRYFQAAAFGSVPAFESAVRQYQAEAVRLFSTFAEAYQHLNGSSPLQDSLRALERRDLSAYGDRTVWEHTEPTNEDRIAQIPEDRLQYLGYISAQQYEEQRKKREALASYLRELAVEVRTKGAHAVDDFGDKKPRKMDSLLRELDSTLKHTPMSSLFVANPAELDAEAARILRDKKDVKEMRDTQTVALRNLSNYVASDHLDVYVATSMRRESDFVSVNRFVLELFRHPSIVPLRLRYFNPTQSWIEDRVAKGLVEALMLQRSSCCIYMAQKEDSFGKDSEASVALGQGKPVVVFVPKLVADGLDSEELMRADDAGLQQMARVQGGAEGEDLEESLDHDGLFALVLGIRLRRYSDEDLITIVESHWANFGLLDESDRMRGHDEISRQERYTRWMRDIAANGSSEVKVEDVREDVISILVATTVRLEKRARVFREVHPLALQVILSSGVLNGILVARSVDSCATVLRAFLENHLELELCIDDDNYRLVERTTRSTVRVISRNTLLVNGLNSLYGRL